MSKKYVSRVKAWRNGTRLDHMKEFKLKELTYRAEVDVEGGGTVEGQIKDGFTINYAVPKLNPKLDWSDCVDDTWMIELEGGKRVTLTGVDILKQGEIPFDFQKEAVITLDFASDKRVIE